MRALWPGLLALGLLASPSAAAAPPEPLVLNGIVAPASVHRAVPTRVSARLHLPDGTPAAGVAVVLERAPGGRDPDASTVWTTAATAATDAAGAVAFVVVPQGSSLYRLRAPAPEGDLAVSAIFAILTTAAPSTLALATPTRVRADTTWRAGLTWTTSDGLPVAGEQVLLQRRQSHRWVTVARTRTGEDGHAVLPLPAVDDGTYRAVAAGVPVAEGAVSATRVQTVAPAYAVVADPPGAPRPTRLPPQPRATTAGADVRIMRIPDDEWAEMVGATWHAGCPVGRDDLRLLTMNYYGFDGFRHGGEIVVSAREAPAVAAAFRALYAVRYPIRSMWREDRFGWNASLRGADDYASMAADNTSGFNCRQVVGDPSSRSPHAYGVAVDINPLENPDVARNGTWPSSWYATRRTGSPAVITSASPVVRTFARIGWLWGGSFRDYQHFDHTRGHD